MEIEKKIRNEREKILSIAAANGARSIRMFGSMARGRSSPGSDLDLIIDMEPGRSLLDLIAIKQDLEDLLGCKVDVVTESSVSPYIRDEVLKEAVNL